MSKMASSKSKKSKEIKEEIEEKVSDEETTRLDKLKVEEKIILNPAQDFNSKKHPSIH